MAVYGAGHGTGTVDITNVVGWRQKAITHGFVFAARSLCTQVIIGRVGGGLVQASQSR